MSTWLKFYIAPNLDRTMILGEDWLKKNQAQIRFKPNLLIIKGVQIPLGRGACRAISVYSEERLKAGSADGRLKGLATLFATAAALPRVINLTDPSNISLLKTDSGLAVIASRLITELKTLVVVIVVHDSFLTLYYK